MGGMGETEVQAGREGWYIHFMVEQKLTQNYKAIIFQLKKKSHRKCIMQVREVEEEISK